MPADLRSALRSGARTGANRTLPVAVLLIVLVIIAAGIGGTSHFGGPRWVPKFGGPHTRPPIGKTVLIVGSKTGGTLLRKGGGSLPGWIGIVVIVLIALAVVALLWRWWSGRRLPPAPKLSGASVPAMTKPVESEAEPEPEPEKLLTGIELALVALDEGREPADAVVRAWLGLQETAEESGIVRRASETPTEFTSRILGGAFADDAAVRTLLRLYLRTRFGDHPVTEHDVSEVREALQRLVDSWRPASGGPQAAGHQPTGRR